MSRCGYQVVVADLLEEWINESIGKLQSSFTICVNVFLSLYFTEKIFVRVYLDLCAAVLCHKCSSSFLATGVCS